MEKLDVSSPRPRIWIGEKKWKNIKFAIAFPKVLYNEDIGIKIFQYLTEQEIWIMDILYVLPYANLSIHVHDTCDPYIAFNQQKNSSFLLYCIEYKILLKKLSLEIVCDEAQNDRERRKQLADLLKATEDYLKAYGDSVLSISLTFTTFTTSWATIYICTILKSCKNLIRLSLNGGPMMQFELADLKTIMKAVKGCRNLRDWSFNGGWQPFMSDTKGVDLFCKTLGETLGPTQVLQLFLDRGLDDQPTQHTLSILLGMRGNSQLRVAMLGNRTHTDVDSTILGGFLSVFQNVNTVSCDFRNLRELSNRLVGHLALKSLSIWGLFGNVALNMGNPSIDLGYIQRVHAEGRLVRLRQLFREMNWRGVRITYLGLHANSLDDIRRPLRDLLSSVFQEDTSLPYLTTLNISTGGEGVMDIYPTVKYEVPSEGDFYDNLVRRAQVLMGSPTFAPTFADAEEWLANLMDHPPNIEHMPNDEHRDIYLAYRHFSRADHIGSVLRELLHAPSTFAFLYARGMKEQFNDLDIRNLQRAKYAIYF